jgi:hypothetical protein
VGIPHHGMADAPEPVGADRLRRLQHRRHARRPGSGWRDRQWRQQPGRGRTNRLRRPRPSPGRIRLPPRVGADGPGQVEDEFRTFLRCGGEACHDDPAAPTGDGKCPTSMTRLLPRSITSALSRAASALTPWPRYGHGRRLPALPHAGQPIESRVWHGSSRGCLRAMLRRTRYSLPFI